MKNIEYVASLYFRKVSAYNIFQDNLRYDSFDENEFARLMFAEFPNITESETSEICSYLKSYNAKDGENGLNVFRLLKEVTAEFLEIRNNCPICQYDKLLSWRKIVENVGEDALVCAFLAREKERSGHNWDYFAWNPVLENDNVQLNRILQRGLSDNHFHLFGSAPTFKLIWIRLMNELLNEKYIMALQAIDNDQRRVGTNYSNTYKEEPLVRLRFKAAIIRRYLLAYLERMEKGQTDEEEKEKTSLREQQIKVEQVLKSDYNYFEYYGELQEMVDGARKISTTLEKEWIEDYAYNEHVKYSINLDFWAERKLMYQMFLGEVAGKKIPSKLMNWFYAYLVIQVKFRGELVQVNDNSGFQNFGIYSRRKSNFLNKEYDMRKMIKHAVGGSLLSGNIRSLELRITPERTAVENRKYIEICDFYIRKYVGEDALKKTYYVFHFPKKKDDESLPEKIKYMWHYRHYQFRTELEKKANQIMEFRELYPESAERVLGIDACSQELYCRPEVFAPVFRMLSEHVVHNAFEKKVSQLKITYHVGEDWFDVVDGLRAIDEAILFLGMRNGDRLGHATVLGIDIQDWYKTKNRKVWISLQNYLDNIVWLYHKLIEFDISNSESLKGYLLMEYDQCFRELYRDIIDEGFSSYNIETYYLSWKLRGDHPMLYETQRFKLPVFYNTSYMINERIEGGTQIRREKEAAELMYYYHYSASVRRRGQISLCKTITDSYLKGVQKVQKAMQRYVADCGISIEANPSSNYKISTIDKYEKHPILNFYNMGLTWDDDKLRACPQLHASINTDDKGVFDTSLENEFALMGCALENMRDEDGKRLYSRQMVYDWLDRIRENGNQQSFMDSVMNEQNNTKEKGDNAYGNITESYIV